MSENIGSPWPGICNPRSPYGHRLLRPVPNEAWELRDLGHDGARC